MSDNERRKLTPLEIAACKTGVPMGALRRAKGENTNYRPVAAGETSCYHLMSRTTGGDYLFDAECKEAFVLIMRRMAKFSGIEILTYCVMDNHFHLLARVPKKEEWMKRFESFSAGDEGEERLIHHLHSLYSKAFVEKLRAELEYWRELENEAAAQEILQGFRDRLCDVILFMKELKERYTRWYNKLHGRQGTLWMNRYRSVLVENGKALRMIAAYIDLNPTRAKLVKEGEPEAYRWCGYGEAIGKGCAKNDSLAKRGLKWIMEAGGRKLTLSHALELYRNSIGTTFC